MADYDKDLVQYSFYEKEEEVASQFKEAQIISCNSLAAVKETLPKKVREFKTPKELTSEEVLLDQLREAIALFKKYGLNSKGYDHPNTVRITEGNRESIRKIEKGDKKDVPNLYDYKDMVDFEFSKRKKYLEMHIHNIRYIGIGRDVQKYLLAGGYHVATIRAVRELLSKEYLVEEELEVLNGLLKKVDPTSKKVAKALHTIIRDCIEWD
jgi:hypothetical protein